MKFIVNRLIELLSIQFIRVRGRSMEPTIAENSWVFTKRAGFRNREPRRFDVVRLEDPLEPNHWILKRIVGLPGETVELRSGVLFVDEQPVVDRFAYCPDPSADNNQWWPRPDEYVVLGDNRAASTDSRKFGPVRRSAFRGRLVR
ncbi:MAG: signal peptidase I [Chloroflexi bacterium]|nr:signal peptidase I [Chloroflexota bacterium]